MKVKQIAVNDGNLYIVSEEGEVYRQGIDMTAGKYYWRKIQLPEEE